MRIHRAPRASSLPLWELGGRDNGRCVIGRRLKPHQHGPLHVGEGGDGGVLLLEVALALQQKLCLAPSQPFLGFCG